MYLWMLVCNNKKTIHTEVVFRRLFGPKIVTEIWRKLLTEELHNFTLHKRSYYRPANACRTTLLPHNGAWIWQLKRSSIECLFKYVEPNLRVPCVTWSRCFHLQQSITFFFILSLSLISIYKQSIVATVERLGSYVIFAN